MSEAVPTPLRIVGAEGSPYSRKLRAVLRYRRIPHAWIVRGAPEGRSLPAPRVGLLPQLILPGPDGGAVAVTDSTPLIRRLEETYLGRRVVPPDPALAFLDALLEDYADEWLTKAMFHYRWSFPPDLAKAAAILPRWAYTPLAEERARELSAGFAARQTGRRALVGIDETTAPVIEASYRRLLEQLDARLAASRFVLGDRPGAADFALYGQLTQLAGFDPTPSALALAIAPRVVAWTDVVDDLSGLEPEDEGGWLAREAAGAALRPLLQEVGRVYVPFLLANADALARGAARVECTIDGRPWVQPPFAYQGKCLGWLREAYADLAAADRAAVDAALDGTGCAALFAAAR